MLALLPTLYSIQLLFFSLFAPTDASKYEIRNQGVYEDFISRLNTLLDYLIFNGRAKTKLAMLAFLYCGEFVKNSIGQTKYKPSSFRVTKTGKETRNQDSVHYFSKWSYEEVKDSVL